MTELQTRAPRGICWSPTRQLLVLAGLTGFAISQPLLAVLGDAPTILAQHGVDGSELALLAGLIAFVPPLLVWGATRLGAAIDDQLGRVLHLRAVGTLVGCFAIQASKALGLTGLGLLLVAVVAAVGFVVAYVRLPPVAAWASYTAILPFLAVGSFLLVSPASALRSLPAAPDRIEGADALPSVVLLILDELPTRSVLDADDRIDAARFPNLAEFAEDATWYRHHTAIATLTEGAVPSMLTGALPIPERAIWTNHPDNLFTLLAPTHELEVLEQSTELCPYDSCAPTGAPGAAGGQPDDLEEPGPDLGDLLDIAGDVWFERLALNEAGPTGFDDFTETVGPTSSTVADASTTSPSVTVHPGRREGDDPQAALTPGRADALIQSFDPAKDPALYYLHLMLPHQPFNRYPDGTPYYVVDPLGVGLPDTDQEHMFSWSPWTSAVTEQQHLLQAQYTDRILGHLLAGLRDAGLYEDSLVIVVSDHGISFEGDTFSRYAAPSTLDALAYSPLLVKRPAQTDGAVDDSNVGFMDLLPTIADELGVDIPWKVDGAPIGSAAIDARGTTKHLYDMMGFGGFRIREVYEFDDREEFRTVGDRAIGPLEDPDDPLSALYALLGIDELVGDRLDDVVADDVVADDAVTGRGGSFEVDFLDRLREPGDAPAMGLVTGDVSVGDSDSDSDSDNDATLVLAIDDVIVGGSRLSTDSDGRSGRVAVLLPPGSLAGDNEVRAALLHAGGAVVELDVRSA